MRLYNVSTVPAKLELGILISSRGLVSTLADRKSFEGKACRRLLRQGVSEPARGLVPSGKDVCGFQPLLNEADRDGGRGIEEEVVYD